MIISKTWRLVRCAGFVAIGTIFMNSYLSGNDGNVANFSAPYIEGAYYIDWRPYGLTEMGTDYLVGFKLLDGTYTTPIRVWFNKGNNSVLEVASISSINRVLNDLFPKLRLSSDEQSLRRIASVARIWVSNDIISGERTGFHLWGEPIGNVNLMIQRLANAGMSEKQCLTLEGLCKRGSESINLPEHTWSCMWYEVNREGQIERVSIKGGTAPIFLESINRELMPEYGVIDGRFLKREILIDTSILR